MIFIDVSIPLAAGVILATMPNALISKRKSATEAAAGKTRLQKVGYILLGASFLYLAVMLAERYGVH